MRNNTEDLFIPGHMIIANLVDDEAADSFKKGVIMNNHCCEIMTDQINYKCNIHTNEADCPDILVSHDQKFEEYGLVIHDVFVIDQGGHSCFCCIN